MITPWGQGCRLKASKVVILCSFLSNFYLIIIKIYKMLKLLLIPAPPGRGGVWCDTLDPNVRTTTHQMAWLYIIKKIQRFPPPGTVSPEIPNRLFVKSLHCVCVCVCVCVWRTDGRTESERVCWSVGQFISQSLRAVWWYEDVSNNSKNHHGHSIWPILGTDNNKHGHLTGLLLSLYSSHCITPGIDWSSIVKSKSTLVTDKYRNHADS